MYHRPDVFMMLGLKLASARVEITSTMFQMPSSVGGAILAGVDCVRKSGRRGEEKEVDLRQRPRAVLAYYPVDLFPLLEQ